ncbi:MAG: DUF29 domain-containing protein [Candidatus Competibacteraceae bacterium]|uniref:DUF29 domain-containing protein n=1 Tax=Candidatus Contendobacter odensis Run_B_J11 TaxID=1400861 RepID=A0A7U7GFW2_9GAMM|nr:DUF29 domain-containing protein [Candidatus Contendobacter odensis]MBK8535764.1 DUF29 domain-containing protein [Candidatus Competibacteraceae bacterium]MBK8755177.1 DUF29 domain-containing protein [Candidatus Competibacteraceae bacterium]CDH47656.1 conserved hypothetical protein [Candidatus Contendobacter odensis Run_B_J11]
MTTTTHYETDFYQWTQQQAALLRQGEFNRVDLDFENIAEELESMGRSERDAVESYLANIIMHLLKWQYQPERRGTRWELSIDNGRYQVARKLRNNPSLKPKVSAMVVDEYPQARKNASRQTGLPLATFPEPCPFTVEQITDDYWPD